MIVAESQRGRRLVGSLPRGADLLEAIAELCRERGIRAAALRASGSLERVELRDHDQARRAPGAARAFAHPFLLVSLEGTVAEQGGELVVQAQAVVGRDTDNGLQLLGGIVQRARVHAVDFVLETFDDVTLIRRHDPATGLDVLFEAARRAAPALSTSDDDDGAVAAAGPADTAPADGAPSWSDVAEASAAQEGDDEDPDLRPGDVLQHPMLGRCVVERIEGDQEFVSVRRDTGRLARLALDMLRLSLAGSEGGHRVFRVRVGQQ